MVASKTFALGLAVAALLAALIAGPARIRVFVFPEPNVPSDWQALLREVRAFEQRIGFRETVNFKGQLAEKGAYTICGYAPRFQLPYSYEDPAIRWSDAQTEHACRAGAKVEDVYFTQKQRIGDAKSAQFVRAYETAVAQARGGCRQTAGGRLK
jgi:hypothetical protein